MTEKPSLNQFSTPLNTLKKGAYILMKTKEGDVIFGRIEDIIGRKNNEYVIGAFDENKQSDVPTFRFVETINDFGEPSPLVCPLSEDDFRVSMQQKAHDNLLNKRKNNIVMLKKFLSEVEFSQDKLEKLKQHGVRKIVAKMSENSVDGGWDWTMDLATGVITSECAIAPGGEEFLSSDHLEEGRRFASIAIINALSSIVFKK